MVVLVSLLKSRLASRTKHGKVKAVQYFVIIIELLLHVFATELTSNVFLVTVLVMIMQTLPLNCFRTVLTLDLDMLTNQLVSCDLVRT